MYDSRTGQYTQEDPIGIAGGLNLYGYAGGDPINFSDPFGLCPDRVGGDGASDVVTDCPEDVMNQWEEDHITITAVHGTDWDGVDSDLRNAVIWASMMMGQGLGISAAKEGGHSIEGRHAVGGGVDINTVGGVRYRDMALSNADATGRALAIW